MHVTVPVVAGGVVIPGTANAAPAAGTCSACCRRCHCGHGQERAHVADKKEPDASGSAQDVEMDFVDLAPAKKNKKVLAFEIKTDSATLEVLRQWWKT